MAKDESKKQRNTIDCILNGLAVLILIFFIVLIAIYLHDWLSGGLGEIPASNWCIAYPRFYCINPILADSGLLSITVGQNLGTVIYNASIACLAVNGNSITPLPYMYRGLNSLGWSSNTLSSGQTPQISGLQCYNANGTMFSGPSGTSFSGALFITYPANGPSVVAKIASFTAKTG